MTGSVNKMMTPLEWGMLLLLALFWGGSFFFVGIAVKELPPLTIVALRVSLAAAILWLCAPALGLVMPRGREALTAFLIMALINNVIPFCLIAFGQTQLASGLASILNATTPLFTVLAGHFLTADERLTPQRLAGALCGLLGVAGMIGPQLVEGLGGGVLAELAILGAAVSYAFASIFGRRFRRLGINPIATATGQVTASSLMLIPIALLVDRPWALPMPGVATFAAIAGLASLSTALAYILYFRILASAGATNVALVTLLAPVSSILLGAIVLHEHLAPRHFIGLALIGLGLACIDGRPLRALGIARSA
ncbi:DMT family transporter [Methylocapsa sp. S129]|uniref:DMT family transporter n=1 Tax=Methylocapsa sp. S129 TaxID=1641869 RepID=UPI00131EBF32|nr:DMT family transporter [Methylocapsa sp. S129]